jgi:hypothetical protein
MEADWEFEIGADAPIIDACWPGFVDLRWIAQSGPDLRARVHGLPEAVQLPSLAVALERLNSDHSPVWTSKCDFWPALQPGDFDADELDAPTGNFTHAAGCYIDLLPKSDRRWTHPRMAAAVCKNWCALLHALPLRSCRVDLIIRRAVIAPDLTDAGITAYFTACGSVSAEASQTLDAALAAFVDALCPNSTLQ